MKLILDQVGGQGRRGREVHGLAAVPVGDAACCRAIGDHRVGARGRHVQGEARLEGRFIEARKEAARVSGLELGECVAPVARACGVQASQIARAAARRRRAAR